MAKSVDPDQMTFSVWSGSALFAYAIFVATALASRSEIRIIILRRRRHLRWRRRYHQCYVFQILRLMKFHTHICHDEHCPLPSTVSDLAHFFMAPLAEGSSGAYSISLWCYVSTLASVAQLDAPSDWRPGGRVFNPLRGRQHSFVEIDHEIFSMVILSLPLISRRAVVSFRRKNVHNTG